jgi:hypothetical protein
VWLFYGRAPALGAGSCQIRTAPDTEFRPAPAPAHQPTGGAVPSSLEVDVVPFPTLASVQQLYHFDPELSIHKYDVSKLAMSEMCLERTQ